MTTVLPLTFPTTFGNGAARQVPEKATGGGDDVFYAQRLFGI